MSWRRPVTSFERAVHERDTAQTSAGNPHKLANTAPECCYGWKDALERCKHERDEAREELRQERERTGRLRDALRLLSDPDEPPYPDWTFAGRAEDREEQMHKYAEASLREDNEQGGTA